jgi:regulator of RNase E activity RraA
MIALASWNVPILMTNDCFTPGDVVIALEMCCIVLFTIWGGVVAVEIRPE